MFTVILTLVTGGTASVSLEKNPDGDAEDFLKAVTERGLYDPETKTYYAPRGILSATLVDGERRIFR
jgi:hypothetical protein